MRTIKSELCALTLTLAVVGFARAQEPLDGPHRTFNDELVENLVGEWKLTRQIRGRSLENTVTVEWVLNHQFLRVHMKDVQKPPEYEAMVFIGYDNTSERYVVHWIDVSAGAPRRLSAMACVLVIRSSSSSNTRTVPSTTPSPGTPPPKPGNS